MPEKFKLVMLGPLGVGKSALTVKYLTQRFIMDYDPYVDGKYSKVDVMNDEPVIVKIWDTYTHHRDTSELDRYLKWADGFIVVYSTTSKSSFIDAQGYVKQLHIRSRATSTYLKPIILLGNKVDLEQYRQVSYKDGEHAARKLYTIFHECSATGGLNTVETGFHALIRNIQQLRESTPYVTEDSLEISTTGSLPKTFTRSKTLKSASGSGSPRLLKKSNSTFRLFQKSFKFFT